MCKLTMALFERKFKMHYLEACIINGCYILDFMIIMRRREVYVVINSSKIRKKELSCDNLYKNLINDKSITFLFY